MSEEYILALSEKTGVGIEEIKERKEYIDSKIKEVLDAAASMNFRGKVTKKNLTAVLHQRSYRFV